MSVRESTPVFATVAVLSLLAALVTFVPALGVALEYRRDPLTHEWWRAITAHLVHTGWRHLLLDLAGLWLIALVFRRYFSFGWLLGGCLWLGVTISLGLFLGQPSVEWYRGLSGILHGLLVWGLLRMLPDAKWLSSLALAALAAKLVADGFTLPRNDWIGAPVVTAAHVYGALGGASFYVIWRLSRRSRTPREPQRAE